MSKKGNETLHGNDVIVGNQHYQQQKKEKEIRGEMSNGATARLSPSPTYSNPLDISSSHATNNGENKKQDELYV